MPHASPVVAPPTPPRHQPLPMPMPPLRRTPRGGPSTQGVGARAPLKNVISKKNTHFYVAIEVYQ
jgi:hypothetical protein